MSENQECFYLLPYTVEDIFTMQSSGQQLGWHISSFNLPEVWKITQGEGVTVAVIDSGCDLTHPDLVNNIVPGKNFVEESMQPEDSGQHGTHVSGIIGWYSSKSQNNAFKSSKVVRNGKHRQCSKSHILRCR